MKAEVSKWTTRVLHTKYNCTYHFVFIPKYRRKVMHGKLGIEVGQILYTFCKITGIKLVKGGVCPTFPCGLFCISASYNRDGIFLLSLFPVVAAVSLNPFIPRLFNVQGGKLHQFLHQLFRLLSALVQYSASC